MSGFVGRVALITGGTRGIGYACASELARAGATVAICGRSAETVKAAAAKMREETGAQVHGFAADVGDSKQVDALIKAVKETCGGPIDILVNNAGITRDSLILRMKDTDWEAVHRTNLDAAFYCCRAVARDMVKRHYGRIISISSVSALRGQPGQANYSAAKAGLVGLSKALAHELASRKVTVNVIAPGFIETDMTAEVNAEAREIIMLKLPAKRMGTPEEVAYAVKFIASDEAAYITGQVLCVDGGLGT